RGRRARADSRRPRPRSRQYAGQESRIHGQGRHGRDRTWGSRADHPDIARGFRAFAHGLLRRGSPLRRRAPTECAAAESMIAMDAILVVNAGSSSVKFQIFAVEAGAPRRLIKGQLDGIGTHPRLTAAASDKSSLIDKTYAPGEVADVPAAIATVAAWM